MIKTIKNIWRIIRTRKSERTLMDQLTLDDWVYECAAAPIRVIIFPIMLVVKLYKWTYSD